MKKIMLVILCIAVLLLVTACSQHYIKDGKELYCDFILIRDIGDNSHICYDPETNVCYVIIWHKDHNGLAISPYYIIKHGDPVIAVYGKTTNNSTETINRPQLL